MKRLRLIDHGLYLCDGYSLWDGSREGSDQRKDEVIRCVYPPKHLFGRLKNSIHKQQIEQLRN